MRRDASLWAIAHKFSRSFGRRFSRTSARVTVTILFAFSLLASCQPSTSNSTEPSLIESGQIPNTANDPAKTETNTSGNTVTNTRVKTIAFRHRDRASEFSLQFKSTGGKLLDSSGAVITNLILQDDGAIKLTDSTQNIVGYISRTDESVLIEGPKRTKTLFLFSASADGSALLSRNSGSISNGSIAYILEPTDTGYVVASGKDVLYAVQVQKGKGQLRTTDGQTVIRTDSEITPAALAAFGFDKLTKAQQAGLAYALSTQPI